ncbi:MAG: class I SAM-dependent methyltransferase [Pseudomonadota bacterium]
MNLPLKEGSKDWWAQHYAKSTDLLYGKAPSPFLADNLSLLRRGETLDVGSGEGRNAVYLAQKGFTVTGLDFTETAIERAKKLAVETGVAAEFKSQDLDFFLIPLMKYDTIVVCDYHPQLTLMKNLARGLNKGGTLLVEGYTVEQLRLEQGIKPEPFECFRPNEALEHVRELHLVFYNERQISPKEARVQLIARKPLR